MKQEIEDMTAHLAMDFEDLGNYYYLSKEQRAPMKKRMAELRAATIRRDELAMEYNELRAKMGLPMDPDTDIFPF